MSRALDPEVIAALQTGEPVRIYGDIAAALAAIRAPHEIEILGRDSGGGLLAPGESVVSDGNALGVSKLRLVQAFFVARRVVMGGGDALAAAAARARRLPAGDHGEVRAATAVMLLMDPEHLTAANTRKRCLLRDLERAAAGGPSTDDDVDDDIFSREFALVDSLLTSPLHRHTKSPVLWSHRRWLVREQARRQEGRAVAAPVLSPLAVRDAVSRVVLPAGEKHPRNYYAWCHARWLLAGVSWGGGDGPAVLSEVARRVREWCCRHRGDISGWSFLLHVLVLESGLGGGGGGGDKLARVRDEIMELGARMRWENESVAWFLDMAGRCAGVSGDDGGRAMPIEALEEQVADSGAAS